MEQEKIGEHAASDEGMRALMADDPPYAQAYFMLAQHLTKRGKIEESRTLLREGVEFARQQENAHLAGEMSEFLASLGELGE